MRAVICDRCGERITDEKAGYIYMDLRDLRTSELDQNREFENWDLCPTCMRKIKAFVRMKRERNSREGSDGEI